MSLNPIISNPPLSNGLQHDFILLDRSGSMSTMWREALSSVNSYVAKLAADKVDTGVTLVAFDLGLDGKLSFDVVRDRIIPTTWKEVTTAELQPRGSTPLNDATGRLVALANAGNYSKVAIIIMTDGEENASREYSTAQVRKLLDECRAKEWVVIFLGANFDNTRQATSYNNAGGNTAQVSLENLCASGVMMGSKRAVYGSTGVARSMSFTDDEKAALKSEKKIKVDVTA